MRSKSSGDAVRRLGAGGRGLAAGHPAVVAPLLAALALACAAGADGAIRLREIHVPFREFQELTAGKPDGVVMTLDEYRALILRALDAPPPEAPPELPPVRASIVSAAYRGSVAGKAARLRATLAVRLTEEEWTLVDLGPKLPGLGRAMADGAPGWIVVGWLEAPAPPAAPPAAGAKPAAAAAAPALASKPPKADAPPHAFLLIRGKGEHRVEIDFSLPAGESEDRSWVEGDLVPAAASRLEIEVPGQVDARSEPPFLEASPGADSTKLAIAAGAALRFKVEW
jgi:hypothetical protein